MPKVKRFWLQALIILVVNFIATLTLLDNSFAQLKKNLRFELGDDVRVYSDKAYRKNKGQIFEAVGNVIIISGPHTIYGEAATLEIKSKNILIEGNVRYNTQGMTIYGSRLSYEAKKNEFNIENARIVTEDFNVVAKKIKKVSQKEYYTEEAEFTTCRDCTESWTIYGKEIHLTINEYVHIKNAEVRVKGINILYIPYLVLPVKSERETGLLFPTFYQRRNEGIAFELPFFWAIDKDKDLTVTPILLGKRGYGSDFEYRQAFSENSWLNIKSRLLEDKMYVPSINNDTLSGMSYTRHLTEFEGHIMPTPNFNSHFRFQEMKDIDFLADFFDYLGNTFEGSAARRQGFLEYRTGLMTTGIEFDMGRNFFFSTADEEDKEYIQVLPEFKLGSRAIGLYDSESQGFKNLSWSFDGTYSVFKQDAMNESVFLRNAARVDLKPSLNWQIFTIGAFDLNTNYTLDFQSYRFRDDEQADFSKRSDLFRTEFSFSIDRIFGHSYKNVYNSNQIEPKIAPTKEESKDNRFLGTMPEFKKSFASDQVTEVKSSYRHGQEFKLIHHLITGESESGNSRFKKQIRQNNGWFDYRDAIRSFQADLGANETRTLIPLENTLEFQINNFLIRKTPTDSYSLADGRYLKDNFHYEKIGHLNVSQGVLLGKRDDEADNKLSKRLTRLYLDFGIRLKKWSFDLDEYFFHRSSDHLFSVSVTRKFDYFSTFFGYNFNSLDANETLKTLKLGLSLLPVNFLGITYLHDYDLENTTDINRRLELDLMPNNNCWIFNLSYEEGTYARLVSFNFVFNFAGEKYKSYQRDYLNINRIR